MLWGLVNLLLLLWQSIAAWHLFLRVPFPHIHSNKFTLSLPLTRLSDIPKCGLTHMTFVLKNIYNEDHWASLRQTWSNGYPLFFLFFFITIISTTPAIPKHRLCSGEQEGHAELLFQILQTVIETRSWSIETQNSMEYLLCAKFGTQVVSCNTRNLL